MKKLSDEDLGRLRKAERAAIRARVEVDQIKLELGDKYDLDMVPPPPQPAKGGES